MLLRPPTDADAAALVAIFAEPAVEPWWPRIDADTVGPDLIHDDDPDSTTYVIEVDGEVAGAVQAWEEVDADYRHAGMDIAVSARWHGAGVGADALRTVARHLLDDLGHHRLTIDPAAANGRAIAAYEKLGFRPVGVLRSYERGPDGTFHDGLLMDLLAGELR